MLVLSTGDSQEERVCRLLRCSRVMAVLIFLLLWDTNAHKHCNFDTNKHNATSSSATQLKPTWFGTLKCRDELFVVRLTLFVIHILPAFHNIL